MKKNFYLFLFKVMKSIYLSIVLCITFSSTLIAQPKYDLLPFTHTICQNTYPSNYTNVGFFSIYETDKKGFDKNQNGTMILKLSNGFEFNPNANHYVDYSASFTNNTDITSLNLDSVTSNYIYLSIVTDNNENKIDSIYFHDFEIRALNNNSTGNLYRPDPGGGTFTVEGGNNKPTPSEKFGFAESISGMNVDSTVISHPSTTPIKLLCPLDNPILKMRVTVSDTCPGKITGFTFNTLGSTNPFIDISNAKVYYAGKSSNVTDTTFYGSTNSGVSGTFSIYGNQFLDEGAGNYYFYLSYDISGNATAGNNLDASFNSFVFNNDTINTSTNPNPNGNRLISDDPCYRPDIPDPPPNIEMINSGAFIIPMDNSNQTLGGDFNLKSYGLIHELLMNNIPIKWIIRSGKTLNDTDFTANCDRVFPTQLTNLPLFEFKGSAFAIDSTWLYNNPTGFGSPAYDIITQYGNDIVVLELLQDIMVDVRYKLNQRPRIAIFSNGSEQAKHEVILNDAGITNYDIINAGVFTGISSCYTFCSEPHWNGSASDSIITNNIKQFVLDGGNFLAQCIAIETYENLSSDNIITEGGVNIVNNNVSHIYHNDDLAIMQFEGGIEENTGGSGSNWVLNNGASWAPDFYRTITDTDINNIVSSGAHIISPDSVGGNIFYLGGHEYAPFTTQDQINAARMYLNATLIPSGKPTEFPINPGLTQDICLGDSVQLGGSPTGPTSATFEWSQGNSLSDSTTANPWAFPTDTTTYSLYATDGGCFSGPETVTINVIHPWLSYAGSDTTICGLQPLNIFGVTNSNSYYWSTSGNGTFGNDSVLNTIYLPTSNDTSSGFVYLTLTTIDTTGCENSADSLLIIYTSAPKAFAGNDFSVCSNQPNFDVTGTVLHTTGGIWTTLGTGTFSTPNSLTTTYTPSQLDIISGNINLILTTDSFADCIIASDTITITFTSAPIVYAGNSIQVCPDSTNIPLFGTVSNAGGGLWSTGGTGTFSDSSLLSTNYTPSLSDLNQDSITIYLASTGNGNCILEMDSLTISFLPNPTSFAGTDTVLCNNIGSINVLGSIGNANGGFWSSTGTGVFIPSTDSLNAHYQVTNTDTTNGYVTLILSTTGGCGVASDSITISFTPSPSASLNITNNCLGVPTTITDASQGTITTWLWEWGDGTTSTLNNPGTHIYNNAGIYNINLMIENQIGCIDSTESSITIFNIPYSDFQVNDVCLYDTCFFNNTSTVVPGDSITNLSWYFGNGDTSNLLNPDYYFSSAGQYLVELIVHTQNNCTDTINKLISIHSNPQSIFTSSESIVGLNENIQFLDYSTGSIFTPDISAIINWDWNFYYPITGIGDSLSSIPNPTHSYQDSGTYTIQLIVTNEHLCTDTSYGNIQIVLPPIVPTGFSPDGNGQNDILFVQGGPYSQLNFTIYNSWGEAIFSTQNQSNGWDGSFNGVPQPIGVYVYTLEATTTKGKEYKNWGNITLLR